MVSDTEEKRFCVLAKPGSTHVEASDVDSNSLETPRSLRVSADKLFNLRKWHPGKQLICVDKTMAYHGRKVARVIHFGLSRIVC